MPEGFTGTTKISCHISRLHNRETHSRNKNYCFAFISFLISFMFQHLSVGVFPSSFQTGSFLFFVFLFFYSRLTLKSLWKMQSFEQGFANHANQGNYIGMQIQHASLRWFLLDSVNLYLLATPLSRQCLQQLTYLARQLFSPKEHHIACKSSLQSIIFVVDKNHSLWLLSMQLTFCIQISPDDHD